jgi:flagellar biogenesis protein FliO
MWFLQSTKQTNRSESNFPVQGLAGWLLGVLGRWRGERSEQRKHMCVVETLALGGRKQLMLVTCGKEHFLVGGGIDSVETIVRVQVSGVREGEICL